LEIDEKVSRRCVAARGHVRYLSPRREVAAPFPFSRLCKTSRNRKIAAAVEKNGYSQVEIANYLNLHYSTVTRLVKEITEQQSQSPIDS
jgi:hypothetical protein